MRLPWPIEADQRVNVTEIRRVEPTGRRYLTGDTNLVNMELVIQYKVSDPAQYVLSVEDPEVVLEAVVSNMALLTARNMEVDTLLTTGRSALQAKIIAQSQAALDRLQVGVKIVATDVKELAPPPAVVDAFNDVSSARGDRETLSLSAEAYASKVPPDTRGQAAELVELAKANATERLTKTSSETSRFESLQQVYAQNPVATKLELRATLINDLRPGLDVVAVPGSAELVIPEDLSRR